MARGVAWDLSSYTAAEVLFFDAEAIYPFLLLLSYGIIFAAHSVIASQRQEDVEQPSVLGPGGKPLPVTRIKVEGSATRNAVAGEFSRLSYLFFRAGTTVVMLTFVANAADIIHQCVHASWEDIQRFCNDELLVSSSSKVNVVSGFLGLMRGCRCISQVGSSFGVTLGSHWSAKGMTSPMLYTLQYGSLV